MGCAYLDFSIGDPLLDAGSMKKCPSALSVTPYFVPQQAIEDCPARALNAFLPGDIIAPERHGREVLAIEEDSSAQSGYFSASRSLSFGNRLSFPRHNRDRVGFYGH